jgi:homoserine O-acetyltransferase
MHRSTVKSVLLALLACAYVFAQGRNAGPRNYPEPKQADYIAKNYTFTTGETLPEVRIHYTTVGTPVKDVNGTVRNAVIIMHGTGGTGTAFLSASFAGVLFAPGGLLDGTKYYIIMPDDVGHGKSSKPSDGMHQKFPKYTYEDMVRLEHQLVTDGLGVNHMRLVTGTSMGAMHTWMWGYMYPDFMDALMPLASATVEIGGRNRMLRKMVMDSITKDPDFNDGEYTKPLKGMIAAEFALFVMTSSPLQLLKQAPTREQADESFERRFYGAAQSRWPDPNDMYYAYNCSRDYNPEPHLEQIKAPLYAINSADDQVNPPELGVMERDIKHVKHGRYILIPISDATRGHGTHSIPAIWGKYLDELLHESQPK